MFGFIRYPRKYDERVLLEDLKNIWVGSYKLRAFIPRYNGEPPKKTDKEPLKKTLAISNNDKPIEVTSQPTVKENNKFITFAKVVQGSGGNKIPFNGAGNREL